MKQKLLLLAAVLCSAFSAQAVDWTGETLEGNGVYYLYNVNAGVFLNSNGSVGTAPVDQWYFTDNGNGTWTVKALKLNNVINPNATLTGSNSDYNYIWLDVSKSGATLNYVDAYSKDTYTDSFDGATTNLTVAGPTNNSYQFYYLRSWKYGGVTYYGSSFLAADSNGIKAEKGSRNILNGNVSCSDASTYWYLVKKDTYDDVANANYYFKVQSSATLGSSTDLSFDKFDLGDGNGGVTEGLGTTVQYQINVPSGETVNVSIPIYAVAHPAHDFVRFVGWKTSENATSYVSEENPYLAKASFVAVTTAGAPTLNLIAEFTQIYTDAPADGKYALYNPKNGVYMVSTSTGNVVTKDPTKATIFTCESSESGRINKTQYTTLYADNIYVGQNEGSSNNSPSQKNWIVESSGNGYTLHVQVWEGIVRRSRYITTDGSGISFQTSSQGNNSTWMFMEIDHMKSIIANNTALLAVNANVSDGIFGYGTFVAPFDVTLPAGVSAYTVTGFDGSTLSLNKVAEPEGKLMANTAVILKSSSNVYETVFGEAYGVENANSGKYLVGTYESTEVPVGSYLLQYQNDHAAFFLVDGKNGKLHSGKNRAYLTNVPEESSEGEVKAFSLNGSETAIDEIIVVNEDTAIYDLSGRRLSKKPARGIYIQNGKKILVK